MKKVWFILIAVIVVPSFVFVPRINAKDAGVSPNDGWPTKEEIKKIAEDKSIETIRVPKGTFKPEAMPEKKPRFSIELGGGRAFAPWSSSEDVPLSDYKSSSMISAKIGYAIWRNLEVQAEYSNLSGFEKKTEEAGSFAGEIWKSNRNRAFTAFGANLKGSLPLTVKGISFSPYVVGGIGKAKLNLKGSVTQQFGASSPIAWREDWHFTASSVYFKIGGGINVRVYKNLSLFTEYNYWKTKKMKWSSSHGNTNGSTAFAYSTVSGGLGFKF